MKNVQETISWIREKMLSLPGVTEGICFGTPAFYVSKKLLARMKEDGATLAVFCADRDIWLKYDGSTFYITDHYKNYPFMLVKLSSVKKSILTAVLEDAWKQRAGKRLLKQFQVEI